MSAVKDRMKEVIQSQPDDASYDDILRELAFERMVIRGLEDSRAGRVISNEETERITARFGSRETRTPVYSRTFSSPHRG
jgi:predicted transcriptional regulator